MYPREYSLSPKNNGAAGKGEKLTIGHSPGSLSFVIEARREDRKPYPPCTIQNIMAGLYRYTKYKAPTGASNVKSTRDPTTFLDLRGVMEVLYRPEVLIVNHN